MKELSIIVPCHNEEAALPAFFEELYKYIKNIDGVEILLIDDGSKDGTLSVMKELADINREFSEKHCGEIVAGDLTKPSSY